MLNFTIGSHRSCDRVTRRELLRVGSLATLGLTLPGFLERRASAGKPRIRYGLALHVGDVMYGNIGSDTRLDFTVIGPAVNLTARIESMCRQLGRSLLLSSDFVAAGDIAAVSLGSHPLKGIAANQEIFAPAGAG